MTLAPLDILVLLGSLVITVWIGLRSSRGQDSAEAFMVGGRDLPWWAILGSIVATETSTATVISLPGTGFGPVGMKFLQIAFGYFLGRLCVIYILLPLFFQGRLMSAYQVLRVRFGAKATHAASLLFLITRNLGDGLRLFLAALVINKLTGWDFYLSAVMIGTVTILYTYLGGMRSVVWNDCIQLLIYLAGGIATVFILVGQIDGGWSRIIEFGREQGKFTLVQWKPLSGKAIPFWQWLLTDPFSIWAGLIGGAVLTLGTHGTDQMMVQRYLSSRSQRDAGMAIFFSSIVVILQFALFLFIGVELACFYDQNPPEKVFVKFDEIYPHFLVHSFPKNTGLIGLMLAAILAAAMSTLSSSLNASATAVINDFYLPSRLKKLTTEPLLASMSKDSRTHHQDEEIGPREQAHVLRLTRWLTIAFGVVQIGVGMLAVNLSETVVQSALTIASYSAGLLLGLFLLGIAAPKVDQGAAMFGAGCGLLTLLSIQFVVPKQTSLIIAWPWFALIGASMTFAMGNLIGGCGLILSHDSPSRDQ
jgi:SSS family transporter